MAPPTDPKTPASGARRDEETNSASQRSLDRGTLVDRYTILERLGSGGVATVYSAYDAQLERTVALKMLQPHVDLPDVRRRLFREAQAMARLKHPNVVTVYDVGKFRRQIYIAMEFVDGTTLKDWAETSRPWREVLNVLKSAGRGLAAAHEAGLVHRDFKPDNVLVDNDGHVLVSDFGIACAADRSGAPSGDSEAPSVDAATPTEVNTPVGATTPTGVRLIGEREEKASSRPSAAPAKRSEPPPRSVPDPLTETGQVLGTTGYMAPEHLFSGTDDARGDQFAFAVTMYVAFYGKYPFLFTNLPTYCEAVLRSPEPPPSSTKVPSWVHAVIERGLKRDPAQRFPSMKELLAALDRDPSRRRRGVAIASGAVLACAIAATAYGRHRAELRGRTIQGMTLMATTWNATVEQNTRTALAKADAKYGAEIAEQSIRKIKQYATTWADTHRRISEATILRGEQDVATMDRRLRCLDRGREQLASLTEILHHADSAVVQRALDATFALPRPDACANSDAASIPTVPTAPDLRARVLQAERAVAEAQAYGRFGQEKQVEELVARVLPEVRSIPHARTEAELLMLEGESKRQLSDTRGALESFRGAFRAASRAADDTLAVRAATSIVYVLCVWLHKPEEGEQWIELAEAIADRAGHNDVIDAELLAGRAAVNDTSGHAERSIELHEKHIAILKRLYESRDPRVARAVTDLGVSLAQLGQYESAVKHLQEGVDILAAIGGAHNPRLALHYMNLAGALEALERFEEAKGAYAHALALLADRPPGPLNVIIIGQLATVENELGHPDEAFGIAQKGLETAAAIGEKGKFEWHVRYAHAEARGRKSDWRGQAAECGEIVALQRAAGQVAANTPYWPDALACVAEAELELHKVAAAIAHLEESVKLESRSDAEALPKARFALAKALRTAGRDAPRARRLADSARDDLRKLTGKARDVAQIERWLEEGRAVASGR